MRYMPVVTHMNSQLTFVEISQPSTMAAGRDIRMKTTSA
jgi:hypothetical protein